MSEEKKAAAKVEKTVKKDAQPGKLSKILNWFAKLPQRIAKPFKNMVYELKKVTWPSKQKLITYSVIVLLFMLFMGVVIGLLDMGASAGVRLLIPQSRATATAVETVDEAAEEAADAVEEAAEAAADAVEGAAEEAADAVEGAADAAAEAVTDAADTAAKTAEAAAEEVKETVEEAVETATEGNSGEN